MRCTCVLGVLTTVAFAGSARAEEPASGYPLAATARPLLLPANALEAGVWLQAERFGLGGGDTLTRGSIEPRVRYGLGVVEVEGGVRLHLFEDAPDGFTTGDPERLLAVHGALRYRLSNDAALGIDLTAFAPTADASASEVLATAGKRLHLSPTAAVELGLAAGAEWTSADRGGATDRTTLVLGDAHTAVQAQVAPRVALSALARLRYLRQVASDSSVTFAALAFDVEVGVTAAVGRDLDVVAAVDVEGTADSDAKLFTLALVGRRIP